MDGYCEGAVFDQKLGNIIITELIDNKPVDGVVE